MEKIETKVFDIAELGSEYVAQKIKDTIERNDADNKPTVLGLATGSTPIRFYQELVRMHKEDGLSFKNVITFNLDEYYPMEPKAIQSYHRFMKEHLFDHVDIKEENVHIPNGTLKKEEIETYCEEYESKIDAVGGIDIQILGIGRTGHIGFNEPGSSPKSATRLVTLDKKTRKDAAGDFRGEENVPRTAITMGVGTIFKARQIYLMAWGEKKSDIVAQAVEGQIRGMVPATFLQNHPRTVFVVDAPASSDLVRIKTPWLVGPCKWDWNLTLKAVCWLSVNIKKPVLKLTDEDYNEFGMGDLVAKTGSAYELNLDVFRHLRDTITGWPGGKPGTQDQNRPERANPFPKRAVIFSPHPDDDVISMGGTFIRLVDQGHEVHVAYQTSGNIAVHDDDVVNKLNFVKELTQEFDLKADKIDVFYNTARDFFRKKDASTEDLNEIRKIKGLIRKVEAIAGCRFCGIPENHAHFLNLPFYETGKAVKQPMGEEDIKITMDLLKKIQPHQIYVAGDLADPHGTHRVCLEIVFEACRRLKKTEKWIKDCWVWMYRGAWHEWPIEEIEMAIPLSPDEVTRKKHAIFKHQSQKDAPVFPGDDPREFWERAEDRNRETAELYNKLGLQEYEAMEAFRRWHF